jgi:hypothetical protein
MSETTPTDEVTEVPISRDAANWAKNVSTLDVGELPEGAINKNVQGRRVTSPVQGFGKMWQKTYKVIIPGRDVSPQHVISTWKKKFPEFWPPGNNFYGPFTEIVPGDVAVLNLTMPGGVKLSTGVLVLYADDESFTFMTPEGHMFAAWITFSSFEVTEGTAVQVQLLIRASDPIFELAMSLGGSRKEDKFWHETLTNVAYYFGEGSPRIDMQIVCVDKKRQWSSVRNIRKNSAVSSGMYAAGAPFRAVAKPFKRKSKV